MANYSNLKAAIDAVIKANGRQEITGTLLNQTLTAMVNSLGAGYLFMGVATPSTNPGTPDQNVFYLAAQSGTYSNFGSLLLPTGLSVLRWNGSWSSNTIFVVDDVPTAGSNNLVKSGGIKQQIDSIFKVIQVNSLPDPSADTIHNVYAIPSVMPTTEKQKDAYYTVDSPIIPDYTEVEHILTVTEPPTNALGAQIGDGNFIANDTTNNKAYFLVSVRAENEWGYIVTYEEVADGKVAELTNTSRYRCNGTSWVVDYRTHTYRWEKFALDYPYIFDISEYHAQGGILAKYADLTAALGNNGENIPEIYRKGGMSIKFVLTSDNKYVRYNLLADDFSTDVDDWQGVDDVPTANSKNLVTSGAVYDALQGEYVVATATANTGSVATAMVGIYDVNDVLIVEGEGEVTARILYGKTYKVKCSRVYDYLTPAEQTFTANIPSRQVTMQYTYIERDVVTLDQTISDSAQMLSGDIQGDVIKDIRTHSHLYLGTPATQSGDTEGTELICQLSDEDSTKYVDGTTAALDGSEGDQWLKLPVFWWKVVGVGEAAADGAHDHYRLMFALAGEPDPSWNKWQGDRNLVAAKEMKVVNGKGRSVSGGQSTGSFTQAQGNAYAAARNLGCQQVTWEWQWMMCILCYAWNGDTNSQKTNGIGSNSYTRTLGVTDQLGMTDTTPAQATSLTSARFWGLEAWWNCKNEWMGNVVMENYVLRITDQDTKQTRQVNGFIQCNGTGGWNSRMRIDSNGDFVPLAKAGTETTYYCDWVNSNSGSRVLYRSSFNAGASGGVAYVFANDAPSGTSALIGSRLAFNGVITEAESVAAYKAALA